MAKIFPNFMTIRNTQSKCLVNLMHKKYEENDIKTYENKMALHK